MEGPGRHGRRRLHGIPRRDDRQRRLPGHRARLQRRLARRPVLGAERVQHRLRRAARAGRPARGPRRPPADVPGRGHGVRRPPRSCAGSRPSRSGSSARACCRRRPGRCWCRPRCRCCCPSSRPQMRATAVALWSATGAVAAALGPSLGGMLVDWAGWRWVFFVNVPIGLAALVPARRLLREARDPDGVVPDAARQRADGGWRGRARARHREGPGVGLGQRARARVARRGRGAAPGGGAALGSPPRRP